MTDQPGLFPSPVPPVRFCGAAMGGYGSYADISKEEAVLELIVPANMLSGYSINDLNGREYREKLAALLLADAAEASQ